MDEPIAPALVTGLEDVDIDTVSRWPSLPLPASGRGSTALSFDALAKLFAAQRTSLIDADLVSIDTRTLLSDGASGEKCHE
jgi:hypothetical protein